MNRSLRIHVVLACSLIFAASVQAQVEERFVPGNIAGAKLVKGSESPDDRFVLGEMFVGDTTANFIGIITTDKKQMLSILPVHTAWQLDNPHPAYLAVLWSPDSHMVAVHDSLDKHSILHVYREVGGKFAPVTLPDLRSAGEKRLLRPDEKSISSGQLPVKWDSPGLLEVLFKAVISGKGGVKKTSEVRLFLQIPPHGDATLVSRNE